MRSKAAWIATAVSFILAGPVAAQPVCTRSGAYNALSFNDGYRLCAADLNQFVIDIEAQIEAAANDDVTAFNSRNGAVSLSSGDVTTALGFTPLGAASLTGAEIASALGYTPLSTGGGTITTPLNLNGPAATWRRLVWQTAAVNRWTASADNVAESGANAGSNFEIGRWADAGTLLDHPVTINRATGLASFIDGVSITNGATVDALTVTGATQFVTQSASDSSTNAATDAFVQTAVSGANSRCPSTAPTISSGFGTSPSIVASNGTCAFEINVGTGGTVSSGVIGLPTATHGWACQATDVTTQSTSVFMTKETAVSATTATLTNYSDAGAATAWAASDKLYVSCQAF